MQIKLKIPFIQKVQMLQKELGNQIISRTWNFEIIAEKSDYL